MQQKGLLVKLGRNYTLLQTTFWSVWADVANKSIPIIPKVVQTVAIAYLTYVAFTIVRLKQ